ncbi:hypothetical protein BGW38_006738, partial [Lunasporangiospora selenospora]
MAIQSAAASASSSGSSSPSPSPTATSSPTLSSPSTSITTPASHHLSPSSKSPDSIADPTNPADRSLDSPDIAASFADSNSNSIFLDDPVSAVKGINILNGLHPSNATTTAFEGGISDPFELTDYFSSSVPKSNFASSGIRSYGGGSVHIGSLTNGLSGLSLAAQNLGNSSSTSLASSIYGYGAPGTGNTAQEEITTIFVVGFPDDMQEREFQNMFVFTPGFEAATLKVPHKDQQEDDALTLGVNGVNPRKQIIGFAKFRSHQEALHARDVLNGRRVDAEKGSLLKAEMAKKNLHTRRGLSNTELVTTPGPGTTPVVNGAAGTTGTTGTAGAAGTATPASNFSNFSTANGSTISLSLSSSIPPTPIGPHPVNINNNKKSVHPLQQHRNSLANIAAYDAFHSVPCSPALPSDLLSPNDYGSSYDIYSDIYASNLSFAETFSGRFQQTQQQPSSEQLSSSFLGRQSAFELNRSVDPLSMGSYSNNIGGLAGSISGSFSTAVSGSFSTNNNALSNGHSIQQRYNSSKNFFDMDPETPTSTISYLSKSIPAHTERGFNGTLFNNDELSNGSTNNLARFQGLPINTATSAGLGVPSALPSPSVNSPGYRTPINPGDQNPPCNTLYVGNLPMNTSEDELRAMFSRCVGYRRLCFRTKANGPMCFVEFENVECATQALNDMYGNMLSNSVKGGIRLSFSKNPL